MNSILFSFQNPESFTNIKVPDVPSWFGNTKNGTPNVFATKSIQEYIDDALKPVQKSAADVVEGAVKTGVDQAMSSITDNFQIDVYDNFPREFIFSLL